MCKRSFFFFGCLVFTKNCLVSLCDGSNMVTGYFLLLLLGKEGYFLCCYVRGRWVRLCCVVMAFFKKKATPESVAHFCNKWLHFPVTPTRRRANLLFSMGLPDGLVRLPYGIPITLKLQRFRAFYFLVTAYILTITCQERNAFTVHGICARKQRARPKLVWFSEFGTNLSRLRALKSGNLPGAPCISASWSPQPTNFVPNPWFSIFFGRK